MLILPLTWEASLTPANVPGKAEIGGLKTWTPATHMEDVDEASGSELPLVLSQTM